jgi:hypothetical protein
MSALLHVFLPVKNKIKILTIQTIKRFNRLIKIKKGTNALRCFQSMYRIFSKIVSFHGILDPFLEGNSPSAVKNYFPKIEGRIGYCRRLFSRKYGTQ